MAHINKLIDYTVVVYIVYKDKVLLIDHKELKKWLPIGGHIELDEDPIEAIFREVKEECGLDIEIIAEKPDFDDPENKFLFRPQFLDIHKISNTHRHVGMVFFAKSKFNKVKLLPSEHNDIRWFSLKDLENPKFSLRPTIKHYAKEALKLLKW